MIALGDLAHALAAAGGTQVPGGARLAAVELAIASHATEMPTAATIRTMRLRYPDPPRFSWLARWRRARRRRDGVHTAHLLLRWTPARFDLLIDGQVIARLDPTTGGPMHDPAAQDTAR